MTRKKLNIMQQDWAEDLPENCPPEEASHPENIVFYRLMSNPIAESDFYSHRKLFPIKFFRVTECVARSLSIWADKKEAEKLLALPTLKNKKTYEILLTPDDGQVLQTGKNQNHFSWWRTKNFDFTKWEI